MAYIRKRGSRWRAEVERNGVRESDSFATRAAAATWALERESVLRGDKLPDKTLKDACDTYAIEISPSKGGAHWEKLRLAALARDPIGARRLANLTDADLEQWRDRRRKEVADSTVRREMNLLQSVLKACVKPWRWLKVNPLAGVDRPKGAKPRTRRVSDDEARRVCLALGFDGGPPQRPGQRVAVAFRFAIETAMREGEIAALTWAHTDLDARCAHIPKSKNGDARDVALSREAIRLLKLLPQDDERVFNVSADSISTLFRKARDRAGIVDMHFHDTRHEGITRLARKVDVLDLARMVGHRDLKSLMIYYNATATEIAGRLD